MRAWSIEVSDYQSLPTWQRTQFATHVIHLTVKQLQVASLLRAAYVMGKADIALLVLTLVCSVIRSATQSMVPGSGSLARTVIE
jgi:hypothetical protein